ncbi:MAG: zinc metallopeptidase [Acutalibacteraceae bacterium]|nr:zinc metallopeptidase [Acutalibacteraceae bacterium]
MIYSFSEYLRYLIFAAPVLIFAIWAQIRVKSTYSKYSKIRNSRGLTGAAAAELILTHYGVTDVRIEPCRGELTDHYSPNEKVIRLSENVYHSTSVAAVGIACHEAGHAAQHAEDYLPNKIRTALVPVTNFGSRFGLLIAFAGYFLALLANSPIGYYVIIFGLLLYGLVALFQFVTLPVEFNASKRALQVIDETGILAGDEYKAARRVLTAAALTYVAALATAIVNLLYYAIRLLGNSKRN